MKEATKQLGIRIPASQYLELKKRAVANDTNLTDLIISIFDNYLDASIPGMCPNCLHQNIKDAKFCSECSTPLVKDAYAVSISSTAVPRSNIGVTVEEKIEDLQSQINEIKEYILKTTRIV